MSAQLNIRLWNLLLIAFSGWVAVLSSAEAQDNRLFRCSILYGSAHLYFPLLLIRSHSFYGLLVMKSKNFIPKWCWNCLEELKSCHLYKFLVLHLWLYKCIRILKTLQASFEELLWSSFKRTWEWRLLYCIYAGWLLWNACEPKTALVPLGAKWFSVS